MVEKSPLEKVARLPKTQLKTVEVDGHEYQILAMQNIPTGRWIYTVSRDGCTGSLRRSSGWYRTKQELYDRYPNLKKIKALDGMP